MKLPNTFIVFGEKYVLKRKSGMENEGFLGKCSPKDKTIHIDAKLKDEEFYETVLHELFHAALFETSANQPISPDLEEVIVDVLSRVVVKNFNISKRNLRK